MSFRVVWETQAENQLANLWMAAADRDAVTSSANEIDEILANQGMMAGESRSDAVRILFCLPLGCYFQFREVDQTMLVAKVWGC